MNTDALTSVIFRHYASKMSKMRKCDKFKTPLSIEQFLDCLHNRINIWNLKILLKIYLEKHIQNLNIKRHITDSHFF